MTIVFDGDAVKASLCAATTKGIDGQRNLVKTVMGLHKLEVIRTRACTSRNRGAALPRLILGKDL